MAFFFSLKIYYFSTRQSEIKEISLVKTNLGHCLCVNKAVIRIYRRRIYFLPQYSFFLLQV